MRDDKIDVIAFQELNVHRNNLSVIEAHKQTANALGYKLFIAPTAEVSQIGGTAILVSLRMISEGSVATFLHSHPKGNYVRIKLTNPIFGTLYVWSIYAPADGIQRRNLFLKMAAHVNPETLLMGDFNCVEDVALDTRRSANSPYENTGADVLTYIKVYNKLEDQMRCQLGYHFNFTRSESDDTGRYCSTRIDRHYLPQIINHIWDSEITDLLIVNSDHSAIKSTLRSAIPGSD
eukprot:3801134-Pleurochrysis_carterae.AAC.1